MSGPVVSFDHVFRLSDEAGLFEHAKITVPRLEHGYCVDDVARGLLVIAREPEPSDRLLSLARKFLVFVIDAQASDGRFHNRRGLDLRWQDNPTVEDCWGRALWGLGTAVARIPSLADRALAHFERSARRRSPHVRAMVFAALGAAEVLVVRPGHPAARAMLADAVAAVGSPGAARNWRWPEPRLRYSNAALAETLLAAGTLLGDRRALRDGLTMLDWLLEVETSVDHLSITPVGGWAVGEPRPGFDQQPIEVAALADACARAFDLTGEAKWSRGVQMCASWFLGDNDAQVALTDSLSGGGCDGLERAGRNENQGAESTLAMISTFQQINRMLVTTQ